MSTRPTLADIARRTGLSTATVSMALNRRSGSRIPAHTVDRVQAAAAELGYVSDHTARSLRTGRTFTLGFVSDEVTITRFASAMVGGLLDEAEGRDHAVMIMETRHRAGRLAQALTVMRSRRIDGVAVGLMDSREIRLPIPRGSAPRVIVNGAATGWHGILPDGYTAGREAVTHLLERGHRRIGLIGRHPERPAPEVSVTIGIRMDGIDAAMTAAGLTFSGEFQGSVWEPELGFRGTHAILDEAPDTTAILAANDRIAFGVYQALHERRCSIPEDVSVMSFDDEELASLLRPGLTTMRLPYEDMGRLGASFLLDALEETGGATPATNPTLIPLTLVERGSVRSR